MSDTKSVKVEELPQPPQPEITASGVKIYPTSFVPVKAPMEPSRLPTTVMTGLQIEVIHVVIFFLLTFVLFMGMWKRPNSR